MTAIVHLLSGLAYGGKERAALRLALRARSDGFDVGLVLYDTPYRSPTRDMPPGDLPVTFLPRRSGFDPRFAWRLAGLVSRRHVGLIHAHGETALVYAAMAGALARARRPGLVATFHTHALPGSALGRMALKTAARRADSVVAVCASLRDYLLHAGLDDPIDVVANGVELDRFAPRDRDSPERRDLRDRLGVGERVVLVGAIGRLDRTKRHADLVAAMRVPAVARADLRLLIVGDGPERDRLRASIEDDPRISLLGPMPDPRAFFAAIDIFVLPSEVEAAPLVLLEAMACGLPCVVTAVGGVPEIVGPAGESGAAVVDVGAPAALGLALADLAADVDRRGTLGVRARARAARFDFEREWQAYRRIYEALPVDVARP